jgi:hypothetical protein
MERLFTLLYFYIVSIIRLDESAEHRLARRQPQAPVVVHADNILESFGPGLAIIAEQLLKDAVLH